MFDFAGSFSQSWENTALNSCLNLRFIDWHQRKLDAEVYREGSIQ